PLDRPAVDGDQLPAERHARVEPAPVAQGIRRDDQVAPEQEPHERAVHPRRRVDHADEGDARNRGHDRVKNQASGKQHGRRPRGMIRAISAPWTAAAVSGLALAASFPPMGLSLLAWFAPWPLLRALGGRPWRARLALASLAGLLWSLGTVGSWLYPAAREHLAAGPLAAAALTVAAARTYGGAHLAGLGLGSAGTWPQAPSPSPRRSPSGRKPPRPAISPTTPSPPKRWRAPRGHAAGSCSERRATTAADRAVGISTPPCCSTATDGSARRTTSGGSSRSRSGRRSRRSPRR